ncbi:hypothetical protein CC77DRAFT_1098575 [Alternaria alternata]|uniref:Uncharacterized protein n=1 Tax=Alternaria alternata TaxID=5599 RepID=A0A177D8P6_ALTAL|nr:hypothetical protein CC77DRAFT_1098575 [Alternaria alternata]XP_051590045.1 uncharacterized protein J4E82_003794 [Alternaria postmessia]KAI5377342.1 hypothetical protein J4E82_003794 [Alternaria postmessia]OAG15896.1 hypothetical protein CC77DRAFT_1098575 [Alternaria alternata]
MPSPLLSIDPQRPSFSPADCRTLQRMLHDVRSPSPLSPTPYFSNGPASQSILTETPNSKSYEDNMSCKNLQSAHGDERQDGYEDEDDSMELSDGEDAFGAGERDRDTIEDIMNMPGKMASSVPVCDYSRSYPHNQQASDGARELERRRASIERSLKEQCRQQKRVQKAAAADGDYNFDMPIDGVSDHRLAIEETFDLKALYKDKEMHRVEGQQMATNSYDSSEASRDCHQMVVSPKNVRKALEDTPPASNFSVNFSSPACAVVRTPNGKHVDFATCDSIPDSPVDHTRSCVKAQESDEISPSEHQGHASPQRKLTELAREARVEKEEVAEQRALAELDKFRDMDLAPIETVMDGGSAGDLITYGTPVKAKDEELFLRRAPDGSGSELEGWNHIKRWQSSISPPRRNPFFIEQDRENGAGVEESNTTSVSTQQQLSVFPRRPTFITVIGMLPAVMFWATIAQVVDCSSKVFDVLIERLTGLKV